MDINISQTFADGSCLKCEVGVNEDVKALECEGSWGHMKDAMKDKFSSHWDDVKNEMTSGMTGIIDSFKDSLSGVLESVQNVLQPSEDGRRKRDIEEEGTAEPEPEADHEDYYCIKKSLGNHTVKSCMPKVDWSLMTTLLTIIIASPWLTQSR